MTKAKKVDHTVVVDIINGLPAAWREAPPAADIYTIHVRPFVEAGHAAEVDYVWAELVKPARGYSMDDLADVLDCPDATDEELAQARPFADVFPELHATIRRHRGPQRAPKKVKINLRVDQVVLDHFKATGVGWQVRMNDVLKHAANQAKEDLK